MIAFAIFVLLFANALSAETVKYAAVIFRHGDRTPVSTYPLDPWRNESLWPVKFGELTNTGKQQHYALGKWLRKRYAHLLSDKFNPSQIYVRSTDVDRTLMSAQANLAGLYPPIGNAIWDNDLMWQPIPVHTVPEKDDEVLAMMKPCPAYNQEMEEYISSEAYKEGLSEYQSLMDYLSAYSGLEVTNYGDILDIYSVLYIESLYKFPLPDWTKPVFPERMKEPAGHSFTIATATPLLARLKVGPLIKQIMTNMFSVMASNESKDLALSVYSGHDLTVGSILNALGMYDGRCPPYTATVFFELIYNNTTPAYYIRISYRNSTEIVEPHVLNIPYCGDTCPVSEFIELYDNLLSVDWQHDCERQGMSALGVAFFVGIGLCIILLTANKIYVMSVTTGSTFSMYYTNIQEEGQCALTALKGGS